MPSVLAPKSHRRQNASCDRCRHSKRRCLVLPEQQREPGTVCTNCERLGYSCTFSFAESRKNSGQTRKFANARTIRAPPAEAIALGLSDPEVTGSGHFSSYGLDVGQYDNTIPEPLMEFDFENFLNFNSESFLDHSNIPTLPEITHPSMAQPTDSEYLPQWHDVPPCFQTEDSRVRPGLSSIVGCSLNSPVRLLSSSWEAKLLSEHLARIYQTITSGSAAIFLDYDCNLYTGRYHYRFDVSIPAHSDDPSIMISNVTPNDPTTIACVSKSPLKSLHTSLDQPNTGESGRNSQIPRKHETNRTITVLGAVRFLDHFGDLYGNCLSTNFKAQSDEILKEVLRTFSFQWLSTANSSANVKFNNNMLADSSTSKRQQPSQPSLAFVDAWIRARSLIKNAHSVVSFAVVYATLLFDTVIVPDEALAGLGEDASRHEFLDTGFHKLAYLELLVEKYCANLGTKSEHGALMESCLNIMRWFAYLRDTVVALTTDRPCRLQDIQGHSKSKLIYPSHLTYSLIYSRRSNISEFWNPFASRIGTSCQLSRRCEYSEHMSPGNCRSFCCLEENR